MLYPISVLLLSVALRGVNVSCVSGRININGNNFLVLDEYLVDFVGIRATVLA